MVMKRQVMIAVVAAAGMLTPVLASNASATCWFDCSPKFPVPVALDAQADAGEMTGEAWSSEEASCSEQSHEQAAVPVPWPSPEKCWVCCSPPGGPVCCSSPDGSKTICYGEPPGPQPVPSAMVSESTESCLASVPQDYGQEEVLECRDDSVPPQTASILVRLLQMFA